MRIARIAISTLALLIFPVVGFAEGVDETTSVKFGGTEAKLGAEYRAELEQHDQGLTKTDTFTPKKTTKIGLKNAKLKISGKVTPSVDFKLQYNLNASPTVSVDPATGKGSAAASALDTAFFNWWITDMFAVGMGKEKIRQGGIEMKQSSYDTFVFSPYHDSWRPFDEYAAALDLSAKFMGTFTLQLTDDMTTSKYASAFTGTQTQPAIILEWVGDVSGFTPVIQVGKYDTNHSTFVAAGVKGSVAGADFGVDYVMDKRAAKVGDKQVDGTISSYAVFGSYNAEIVRPFIKFTGSNYTQPKDSDAGLDDRKGNAVGTGFDDNGQGLAVGTFFMEQKKMFRPYVAYVSRSGKFLKSATSEDTETKSESMMKLGIAGEF